MRLIFRLSATVLLLTGASLYAQRFAPKFYADIKITDIGHQRLQAIKDTPGLDWWVELDQSLLVLTDRFTLAQLDRDLDITRLQVPVRQDRLYLVTMAHTRTLAQLDAQVLGVGGRFAVVQSRSDHPPVPPHQHKDQAAQAVHARVIPFTPNVVLARRAKNDGPRALPAKRADLDALVNQVDGYRWFADLHKLSCMNRYTRGTGVDEATQWLVDRFSEMPGLTVSTPEFAVTSSSARNVMAVLEGSERPDEWYIVGAHYDTISQDPLNTAPGAEDNGSGTAGVLELARILTEYRPAATVIFMCYSGEEQGLFGSRDHVSDLRAAGDETKIKAVFTFDMIGYSADETLDCLLETGAVAAHLLEPLTAAAANYTNLNIITSLNPFGSDHVPYLQAGIPAVLSIENDYDEYPGYHRTNDLDDYLGIDMGVGTLRMNLAVLGDMAGPIANLPADAPSLRPNAPSGLLTPASVTSNLNGN